MSLRDYFAAQAMHEMISDGWRFVNQKGAADIAKTAYALADAMLAEREK